MRMARLTGPGFPATGNRSAMPARRLPAALSLQHYLSASAAGHSQQVQADEAAGRPPPACEDPSTPPRRLRLAGPGNQTALESGACPSGPSLSPASIALHAPPAPAAGPPGRPPQRSGRAARPKMNKGEANGGNCGSSRGVLGGALHFKLTSQIPNPQEPLVGSTYRCW